MQNAGVGHLIHHDKHWERCFNLEERIKFIKASQSAEEVPIRLRWIGIVPDELLPGKDSPEWQAVERARLAFEQARQTKQAWQAAYDQVSQTYVQASQTYDQACHAYYQAWQAYVQASQTYDQACHAYLQRVSKELAELHDKLWPGCPWNEEQRTMFPKEMKEENNAPHIKADS